MKADEKKWHIHRLVLFGYCGAVAVCSMVYELCLAQMTALLYGDAFARYSLSIALFLVGLAIGALLAAQLLHRAATSFVVLEVAICLLGATAPVYMVYGHAMLRNIALSLEWPVEWAHTLGLNLSYLISLVIGVMSGMEVPLLSKMVGEHRGGVKPVLALDYAGSSAGALAFPLLIFPTFSIVQATFFTGLANSLIALAFFAQFSNPILRPPTQISKKWVGPGVVALILAVVALLTLSLHEAQTIEDFLGKLMFPTAEQTTKPE